MLKGKDTLIEENMRERHLRWFVLVQHRPNDLSCTSEKESFSWSCPRWKEVRGKPEATWVLLKDMLNRYQ